MLDTAIIPILQSLYTILHSVAAIFWWIDQAILLVGFYITALTDWLVNTAMAPLISSVSNQTMSLLAPVFVLAMTVLGITYLLAVFGTIQIVSLRSAILWLLFAAFVYQVGPQLYQGTESFRRGLGGLFYEEGIAALSSGSTDISALSQIGTADEALMQVPANQFGTWLPYDTAVDGLDVAMAYLYADGCDVIRSGGCIIVGELPYRWYYPGSAPDYFDNTASPAFYPTMSNDERMASLAQAAAGIWRLASGVIVAIFGLIEQVIHFVLAVAMGIAYVSLLVGVLFAFFKRTEPIAWSVFDLVIELFIQSIITSLLLSLVISFVIIGAATGNAVVLFGSSFIGLVLAVVLLMGALKGMQASVNRLLGAMSQVTGGNIGAAGQFSAVAASLTGGATALAGGATLGQAAGIALSGTQAAQTAYYASAAFGQDSTLGSLAAQVFEGASAGRIVSPVVAGFMVPRMSRQRNSDANASDSDSAEKMPMDMDGYPLPVRRSAQQGAVGTPIASRPETYTEADEDAAFAEYYQRSSNSGSTQQRSTPTFSQESIDFLYAYNAANLRQERGLPSYADFANGTVEPAGSHLTTPAAHGETLSNEIAATVDAGDDDDFARLSNTVAASAQSTEHSPESREFNRLATGFHLPPQQAQAVTQQVADTGSIGTQLAASIRSHLASLPTRSGIPLSEANINRAVQALERAAERLASATSTGDDTESLDMQVTFGKPPIVDATPAANSSSEGD
jgi:hypothetical protein